MGLQGGTNGSARGELSRVFAEVGWDVDVAGREGCEELLGETELGHGDWCGGITIMEVDGE